MKAQLAFKDQAKFVPTMSTDLPDQVTSAQQYIAALHSHGLDTHQTSYHGADIQPHMVMEMDYKWTLYIGIVSLLIAALRPSSLLPPEKSMEETLKQLGAQLYDGGELRPTQVQALTVVLRGEKHLGYFAPVSSGKSASFLGAALLSAPLGQYVLLLSPLRAVALNTLAAAEKVGVTAVMYTPESKDQVLDSLRALAPGQVLNFSLLIVSFEAWDTDATFAAIMSESRRTSAVSRIFFDEA